MKQFPETFETPPAETPEVAVVEAEVDLTRICWTQLLRQVPEATEKPPLLKRSANKVPICFPEFSSGWTDVEAGVQVGVQPKNRNQKNQH